MRRLSAIILAAIIVTIATAQPKLTVNIVVGGMKASDLDRYAANFSNDGFLKLKYGGTSFTECYTDFIPTSPEVALATLATGTLPSMHGVSSVDWFDRTSGNKAVSLCIDSKGYYTTEHFTTPTLAQSIVTSESNSRVVSLAHDARSAMVMAGNGGECYWIDEIGNWATAACYSALPEWVNRVNEGGANRSFVSGTWFGKLAKKRYINTHVTDIKVYDIYAKARTLFSKKPSDEWVTELKTTPEGNSALIDFAIKIIDNMTSDSQNSGCKMINICLDTPRRVVEKYGPDSVEYEDMLYYLDADIAKLLSHIASLYPNNNSYLITLTSDHGTGRRFVTDDDSQDGFNTKQTAAILNAFLSAQYGQGSWVLNCGKGAIYLNRDLIYAKKLSVAQIQNEAATFALQFRGMANAATATALQGGAMSSTTSRLMQNTFHPRRSGDILYCLQPNYYEQSTEKVSQSGSPYNYDRHIPLIIYGAGVKNSVIDRKIGSTAIAVTTAYLMGVSRPDCADGELIYELKNR